MNANHKVGLITRFLLRLWPELDELPLDRRLIGFGEVFTTAYALPLGLAGVLWLFLVSDWNLILENVGFIAFLAVALFIFNQFGFFFRVQLPSLLFGRSEGSFSPIIEWTGFLLFGPTLVWLPCAWVIVVFVWKLRDSASKAARWGVFREFSLELANNTIVPLAALNLYARLGGVFPIGSLSGRSILIAFGAITFHFLLNVILHSGYALYHLRTQKQLKPQSSSRPMLMLYVLGLGSLYLVIPFAIIAAGLQVLSGFHTYFFFMLGMLLVSLLAWQLSHAVEQSQLQTRILERLEKLGRAIINSPLSGEDLPTILTHELPDMFPSGKLLMWLFPDEILYQHPQDWPIDLEKQLVWWMKQYDWTSLAPGDAYPWEENRTTTNTTLLCPILDVEKQEPFGAIELELFSVGRPWKAEFTTQVGRGLQSLGSMVASAIHQTHSYAQSLEFQRVTHELELAGEIQVSFLNYDLPKLDGWQVSFALDPAGETFGDFFDIIPLPDGRVGFVIADVADKGIGPALYMALARTLIRTYALELDSNPEKVFHSTNHRILEDTQAGLFVTVFYGVLDPDSGDLHYANAGHNPPMLYRPGEQIMIQELIRTGIPIGISPDVEWTARQVRLQAGDVLVLYTDGVPDAMREDGEFFSTQALVEVVKKKLGQSAEEILSEILSAIRGFVGDAPQFDDITLMVMVRDPPGEQD